MPSANGYSKEPAVAINSTPPPTLTPALAPKAAPAGSSAVKLPTHAPGTPVYPPQSLPGRAPLNAGSSVRAPALPATTASAAPATTAAPANASSALAQASASPNSSRGRPKTSAAARPDAAANSAVGAPLAAGAISATDTAPAAADESASDLDAGQESPADSGRPGAAAAGAREAAIQDPAPANTAGPVVPFTNPSPASPDATATSAAAAPATNTAQTSTDPAALLADPANVRSSGAAANATPALTVHAEVGASGWTEEVGAHVVWMAHQGVTDASLRLQPEHLGPLEVKISVHDSEASVWFGANAPATRAALEQALPQLKELFAAQGLTLTDAGVSGESSRDAQYAPRAGASATDAQNATPVPVAAPRRGLIDTYA